MSVGTPFAPLLGLQLLFVIGYRVTANTDLRFSVVVLPNIDNLEEFVPHLESHLKVLTTFVSHLERQVFNVFLEESGQFKGGRAAFKAVKEEPLPDVTCISISTKLRLHRFRWGSPTARLLVENVSELFAEIVCNVMKVAGALK